MGQLYWPETVGLTRYSIPSHMTSSKVSHRQTSHNSIDDYFNCRSTKLIEIIEDESSTSNNIEQLYDGLMSLDKNRLDEMIETDLISSSNG